MNNPMVMYGRGGGGGGHGGGGHGGHGGHGGDGHHGHGRGGRGWSDWNDWGFFGLPYPYPVYPLAYAAAPRIISPYAAGPVLVGNDSSLAGPAGVITPLGFKPRKIRKHKRRTVIARPQVPFQPVSLYIPREVAKHFEICRIRVGQMLIMGSRDPIPAELYSNEGVGPAIIQLPPVIPGQHIYLTVRNHTGHSHHFRAALNGVSLF